MNAEARLLVVPGAVVIVEIKPGFADAHHFRMAGQFNQFPNRCPGLFSGVMRMNADGAINVVVGLGDRLDPVELGQPGADGHHMPDAGGLGALEHGRQFFGEVRIVQMAMAVDEHKAPYPASAACST